MMSNSGGATLAHPLFASLVCLQKLATSVFTTFKIFVDDTLTEEAEKAIDTGEMSESEKKKALEGYVKKKTGDLWDHVSLSENTQCASVDWDADWEMPEWLQPLWDTM